MRIRLASPLTFTDGHQGDEFIVRKEGRRLSFVDPATRCRYRISGFDKRKWTVVRETTVNRTIFA
jgi:hypothetical protein